MSPSKPPVAVQNDPTSTIAVELFPRKYSHEQALNLTNKSSVPALEETQLGHQYLLINLINGYRPLPVIGQWNPQPRDMSQPGPERQLKNSTFFKVSRWNWGGQAWTFQELILKLETLK